MLFRAKGISDFCGRWIGFSFVYGCVGFNYRIIDWVGPEANFGWRFCKVRLWYYFYFFIKGENPLTFLIPNQGKVGQEFGHLPDYFSVIFAPRI